MHAPREWGVCMYVYIYICIYIHIYIYIVTQWSGFCKVHIPTHQDANVWSRDKRVASCFSTINLLYEIDMAICTYKAIESSELTYLSLGFMLNLFGPYSTALGCKRTVFDEIPIFSRTKVYSRGFQCLGTLPILINDDQKTCQKQPWTNPLLNQHLKQCWTHYIQIINFKLMLSPPESIFMHHQWIHRPSNEPKTSTKGLRKWCL